MSVYGTARTLPSLLANGSYYRKKPTLAIPAAPTACGSVGRAGKGTFGSQAAGFCSVAFLRGHPGGLIPIGAREDQGEGASSFIQVPGTHRP
jgi:hypothetical protein